MHNTSETGSFGPVFLYTHKKQNPQSISQTFLPTKPATNTPDRNHQYAGEQNQPQAFPEIPNTAAGERNQPQAFPELPNTAAGERNQPQAFPELPNPATGEQNQAQMFPKIDNRQKIATTDPK